MADLTPKNGQVVRYVYLWRREFERGEETGRKVRPVCVTVILPTTADATRILLFPITSQPPGPNRQALSIPDVELLRSGLRGPAWVILDEGNTDLWETSFHVEDRTPLGRFSYSFFSRLREGALAQLQAGDFQPVPRD
jgi:hypothetical protein